MKWSIVLALMCVAVASAQRGAANRHPKNVNNHRGARRHQTPEPVVEIPEVIEEVVVEEVIEEPEMVEPVVEEPPKERRVNIVPEPPVEVEQPPRKPRKDDSTQPLEITNENITREHPCNSHECPAGEECVLNKKEKPSCVCIKKCPKQKDERAKVCTTSNITFDSECEMERQKCLCLRRSDECIKTSYRANALDYYGPCKEFKKCTKFEMQQFPERMREWLFIVMEELANRNNLNSNSKKLARRADQLKKSNKALHWAIPALWKFCDLDSSHDEQMTFQELLPMKAPLKGMEHCTEPFLDSCAVDNKGEISKEAWMDCLHIPRDQEDELKEKLNCHKFED